MDEGSFRLRINYRKAGRLRFLSHLEVVRALERTIRRAALPYAVSQGFNVHMKHAFGPALPVGTAGLDEYLDIWLRAYLPPHEVMERLQAVCVCGLPVIGAAYVPASDKALTVTHLRATYEVVLGIVAPAGAGLDKGTVPSVLPSVLQQAFDRVVSQGALVVEKKGKLKEYDLKTHLGAPICVREIEGGLSLVAVSMTLITQQDGSLRPEQVVTAARAAAEGDATGLELVRVTRVCLEAEEATAHTKAPAPSRAPLRRPGRPRQGSAR